MFFHRKVESDLAGDRSMGENQSDVSGITSARGDVRSVLSFQSFLSRASTGSKGETTFHTACAAAAEEENSAARDAANAAIESVHRLVSSLYTLGERSVGPHLNLPQGVVNDITEHTAGVDLAFSRIKPIVRALSVENDYYAFGHQKNGTGAASVTGNDDEADYDSDKTLIERTWAVSRLLDGMTSIVQSVFGDASTWDGDVECAYATLAELLGLACDEIRRADDEYLAGHLSRSYHSNFGMEGGSSIHDGSLYNVSIPSRKRGSDSGNESSSEGSGLGVTQKINNTGFGDSSIDGDSDDGIHVGGKSKEWRPSASILRAWSHARQRDKLLVLGFGDHGHEENSQDRISPSSTPNNNNARHAQQNHGQAQERVKEDSRNNLIELFRELADMVLRSVEWPRPPPPPSAKGSKRRGGGSTSAYRDIVDDDGVVSGKDDRRNRSGRRSRSSFDERMGSFTTMSGKNIRGSRRSRSNQAKKGESESSSERSSEEEGGDEGEQASKYPFVLLEDGHFLERIMRGGRNDLGEAQTLFLMGEVLVRMGEFGAALDHYNECLRIRKFRLGHESVLVAEAYKSIGNVYNLTNRPVEADACYVEALRSLRNRRQSSISGSGLSENNDDALLVSVLRLRGHIKAMAGETEEAVSILCWCIDIQRSALGKDHPDVADVLWTRASLYLDVRRDESATADFREALRIRKSAYGNEDPVVGDTLHDMGMIMRKKGDTEQAVELLSDALRIRRQVCGEADEENKEARLKEADTQAALAVIHRKSGQADSAIQMYEGCLKLRMVVLGKEDWKVADVHVALGHAYSDKKMYSEAGRHFHTGLTILEKISEKSDARFLQLVYLLGKTEFKDRQYSSAKTHLERFVQLRNLHGYHRDMDYSKAMCMLGKI